MSDGNGSRQLDFGAIRGILEEYFATRDLRGAIERADCPKVSVEEVFEQIRSSRRARAYFNRLAQADRALREVGSGHESGFEAPGAFEREFGETVFEARLDSVLAAERAARSDGGEPQTGPGEASTVARLFGSSRGATATLAAAALAALIAGTVLYPETESGKAEGDDFRARSAAAPADDPSIPRPELEIFCAQRAGGNVGFEGGPETPPGALECPIDGELKVAYRNRSPELKYAAFFGVDETGDLLWYGPSPAAPGPVAVEASHDIEPIGETIRLEVNHSPGTIRVHAVFAPEPIEHAALQRRLERKGGRELREASRLGFERWSTIATSEQFRVTEGDRADEENR